MAAAIPPIPAPTTITFSFNSDVSVVGFAFAIASLVRGVEFFDGIYGHEVVAKRGEVCSQRWGTLSVGPTGKFWSLNEMIGPIGEKIICRKSSNLFVCKVSDRLRSGDSNSI